MGISRYQDASCFGGNKAELHAAAKKHEWKPLYAAPAAAQPDVTQQTLDDVMAGIPARDAEIAELRKEIETLRAQQDADKVDAERWISVNERLPEIHEWRAGSIAGISDAVLTIDEDDPDTMTVQHLRKGGQGDLTTLYWDHGDSPTHWRPAPSLPGIDAARKEQV
ncbi:hypothetical protein ALFP_1748 [Alcaligenes faecalis]|nr:hypothetical protein ALFP_1748 [Alcaligenes faecalis]